MMTMAMQTNRNGQVRGVKEKREPNIPMAELPVASLPGARSAGKDPTVVMIYPLVYCEARFDKESGRVEVKDQNREGREWGRPFCGRGSGEVEDFGEGESDDVSRKRVGKGRGVEDKT